jgi:stalled ribosome rescue protein Dom34
MPLGHAVTRIDHHAGQVFQVDAGHVLDQKVKEHIRYTRQHCSQVRSEHEVFAEVCAALAGIESVLVAGSHTTQVDFRHYVEKHRPPWQRRSKVGKRSTIQRRARS